ncbi:MAG: NAD-dependent epimerase/dehydratase family protein [Deltaproteobacteria bacterium]|nr:NAD-dependent epimerase/dehydratase family protein [Deltaproteobacteria bacterium]
MRCLVTGGTGLIGSNLALALLEQGHEVLITGNESEQSLPGFSGKILYPGFLGIDWEALPPLDALFHQAAINGTRVLDRREMMRANYESSQKLFDHVISQGCRRIVFASSTAVYGRNPAPYREDGPFDLNTPYAESKKLMEEYATTLAARHQDLVIVGLRYCNVYGPRESHKGKRTTMIYQYAQQMRRGNPRLFWDGNQKRDYIYVKDVVQANLLAATQAKESCIVNCGSGQSTTFNRLVEILNQVMGLNRTPEYIPNPYEGNYQEYTQCDMSLAQEKLGFVPKFTIEEGIRDYYESGFLMEA